jgi:uncharacterized protein
MNIVFDAKKSAANDRERGLPFDRAREFDFHTAIRARDMRYEYGEERWVAIGFIEERLHVICYRWVSDGMRVISLRKANARERRKYEKDTSSVDE